MAPHLKQFQLRKAPTILKSSTKALQLTLDPAQNKVTWSSERDHHRRSIALAIASASAMPIATHNSVALASIRKQHQNISDGTQRLADTFQPTYSSHNGWAFAGAAFSGNHLWFTGESREALLSKVIALNVHVAVIYLNEY